MVVAEEAVSRLVEGLKPWPAYQHVIRVQAYYAPVVFRALAHAKKYLPMLKGLV